MNHYLLSYVGAVIRLLVALAVCCACGCGGDANKAKLHGKVTVDGQLVATGSITFVPTDGKRRSTKADIQDGQYAADVPLGPMRVEIRSPKVVGTRKEYDTPDSPIREVLEETIPARFNSQSKLTHEITPANQPLDFALESKN